MSLTRLPISVCMISGAEASRIGRALESVAEWTAEIIVVLNDNVSDDSENIAKGFGAKTFREPWKGHIAQKNSAADKASQDWILGLDADEVVSVELRDEIEKLFADKARLERFNAFSFPRLCWYCGKWIRHGDWYPDRQTRLWRRGTAKWGGVDPHDTLLVEGKKGKLKSDLHHYSRDSINAHLQKIVPFSDEFVRRQIESQSNAGAFELTIRPIWRFLRGYFLKLGFLDGWVGYYIASHTAFSTLVRYAKVKEANAKARGMKKGMKISLVISTYEQPEALEKVLAGVRRQARMPDEVFITDDGSGEPTRQVIERFRKDVRFPVHHIWHPHNGFRKVILLNKAVAAATGDYLVFTDGDCVPHPKYIQDHEALAQNGFWVQGRRCYVKEACVPAFVPGEVSPFYWMLTGKIYGSGKGIRLPMPIIFRNQKQRGIIGCNMAFWRYDVLAVNGFDEAYLGRGIGPDSDLGTRVYNLGRQRKFVYGRAIVYHLDHPVMPRDNLAAKKIWLDETIRMRKVRCDLGLNQYLQSEPCHQ